MVQREVYIFIGKQPNLNVVTISGQTEMKNARQHFLLIRLKDKQHLATFLLWQKKRTSLNLCFFFLSQVKGTLSFTSHTSERSSDTLTDQWNQLGYKRKKQIIWTWKTLLLLPNSCFSPTKSSRSPSLLRWGGDIQSYELLGKVHRLKLGGSQDGVCATSRRASLQRRRWRLCDGLCFHEMSCWKWLIITVVSVWTCSSVSL